MTKTAIGIRHPNGTATHTPESVKYTFAKAIDLLRREGADDCAVILADVAAGRSPSNESARTDYTPERTATDDLYSGMFGPLAQGSSVELDNILKWAGTLCRKPSPPEIKEIAYLRELCEKWDTAGRPLLLPNGLRNEGGKAKAL